MFDHAIQITKHLMYCYSDSADYEYIVRIEFPDDMERALEIANRELDLWGNPDDAPEEEYDYYYNAGYVEVVQIALEREGVEATFFVKEE